MDSEADGGEDKGTMNIKQLKQLIANLPDDVEVLTWDRDTANPVEEILTYNAPVAPLPGVQVTATDAECVTDFTPAPRAAFILVCNQ